MKQLITILIFCISFTVFGQKKIHVFVALCDNVNQGIVPVPKALGNGQSPRTNLYWGALYGVKTHFKRSKDWKFVKTIPSNNPKILERIVFKHKTSNTYLLADAYDGKYIKQTTIDFLEASSGDNPTEITVNDQKLSFGGNSDLVAYVGHDGLMEFSLSNKFSPKNTKKRDAIILACISKDYFKPYLQQTGANPLVWSTGLMSPEAYTLKWAIDGWILNESDAAIRERAAKAYHKYQKCGMRGARGLLVTGY
ncbi:hypothetical protein [uncultured Kordia sp.]|uniref:hypothetical protein n=1 Tax=uncultured Kordia sp. TaxID=507699 RepID=UPI00261837AC|nr:hypothetical protein [uncultured Kordia sp.]